MKITFPPHLDSRMTVCVPKMERLRKLLRVREVCPEIGYDCLSANMLQGVNPAYLERSRSGGGAHVWIFFERATAASLARKLGAAMLTRTMERRHQIGLDSYDRLFPNQDTMPQGGFGNLIALPLQRGPRNEGNSVFLGDDFCPIPDQWSFLSLAKRLSIEKIHEVVREAERTGNLIGVRLSACDEEESDPWLMPPSQEEKTRSHRRAVA